MISFSSTKRSTFSSYTDTCVLGCHDNIRALWRRLQKPTYTFEQRLCLHYIGLSFLRRREKRSAIVWTGSAHNWNKLFTHVDHLTVSVDREGLATNSQSSSTSEYLLLSQRDWAPVLATSHLLPIRTEKLFTLRRRPIHQRGAASLQRSRKNHCSEVWTEVYPAWLSCQPGERAIRCSVKLWT